MQAAVYIRVSSAKQAEHGLSLPEQRARCLAFAEQKGWTVADGNIYSDEGVSGGKASRPALDRLMTAVDAGEFDALLIPKLSRLGRNTSDNLALFSRFMDAGVELHEVDGGRKLTKDDTFIFTVESAVAARERELLSERVAAVTGAKAARGSYHGGIPPYGYRKKQGGGIERYEAEAQWVRYMFNRYTAGASLYAIASELNEQGAPTNRGGEWKGNRVGERIDQPIYAGYVKDGRKGKHEPLIDTSTWQAARKLRTATKQLQGNGRGRQASIHLLTKGLLTCECGAKMRPRRDSGSGRRTYRCETQMVAGSTCTIPALPQIDLDSAVLAYVSAEVISPDKTLASRGQPRRSGEGRSEGEGSRCGQAARR